MSTLYSHTATPTPLPHRIRFADDSTRTDASTFTPDELERAGYSGPYERPECNPKLETIDWAAYRQALRDLADAANPFGITWPQPPAISAE